MTLHSPPAFVEGPAWLSTINNIRPCSRATEATPSIRSNGELLVLCLTNPDSGAPRSSGAFGRIMRRLRA